MSELKNDSPEVYNVDDPLRIRENLGLRTEEEAKSFAALFAQKNIAEDTQAESFPRAYDSGKRSKKFRNNDDAGDVWIKYKDRVELDTLMGKWEFSIKSAWQVLLSEISFFRPPPDRVSTYFVQKRMPLIYETLEQLVTTVRILLPRNNHKRSSLLRETSPFSFNVLNVIRHWDLGKISNSLSKMQFAPKNVYVSDFRDILRAVYRPIMILDAIKPDEHCKLIITNLYYAIYAEAAYYSIPSRDEIILTFTILIKRLNEEVRYFLYPLLLKVLCRRYEPYDTFFVNRKFEIGNFLEMKPEDRIVPPIIIENVDDDAGGESENDNVEQVRREIKTHKPEEDEENTLLSECETGLKILSILFPQSGWARPSEFPDFYQYYAHILPLHKASEMLDPENPVSQIMILCAILQEVFYGWGNITLVPEKPNDTTLYTLINSWNHPLEQCYDLYYAYPLIELYDYYTQAHQFRQKSYGDKMEHNLLWITLTAFLPKLKVRLQHMGPVKDNEFSPLCVWVEDLYKQLKIINKSLEVPFYSYERNSHHLFARNLYKQWYFDIPNPVSKRLNSLVPKEARTNAHLMKITFYIVSTLHYLMNDETSWAYSANTKKTFRSRDEAGISPEAWKDAGLNPDTFFRDEVELLRIKYNDLITAPKLLKEYENLLER
jgi:hypothetical protein